MKRLSAAFLFISIMTFSIFLNPMTAFAIEPVKVEGTDFSVTYNITNSTLVGLKADKQSDSLIVTMETTGDGTLSITMPRALIDAKINDTTDDTFFVLIDGLDSDFTETKTTTDRTLTIPFTIGTQEIEIVGKQIIPEFGPLAGMIIAISIIGSVLISTKSRFPF